MAKRAGLRSLSICNVDNSSIVRESDRAILTRAGIEKGVASTKAICYSNYGSLAFNTIYCTD